MQGFPILFFFKGTRRMMFQLSGFYCRFGFAFSQAPGCKFRVRSHVRYGLSTEVSLLMLEPS